MTSRWVVDVAPQRDVAVRWRAFSLAMADDGPLDGPGHGALRVVEAVWAEHGDEPIGRLYTELGRRFHLEDDQSLDAVAAAVEAAGLDRRFADAAGEARWDAEIRGSMDDAIEHVGTDVGLPILVFRDGERVAGTSGPVMSPSAKGDEGLRIWDSVVGLVFSPSFFELKRSRTVGPQL